MSFPPASPLPPAILQVPLPSAESINQLAGFYEDDANHWEEQSSQEGDAAFQTAQKCRTTAQLLRGLSAHARDARHQLAQLSTEVETRIAAVRQEVATRIERLQKLDVEFGQVESWIAIHTDFDDLPWQTETGAPGMIAALERLKARADGRLAHPPHDLVTEARFLLERLEDFESADMSESIREWHGHVAPSVGRLRVLLDALGEVEPRPAPVPPPVPQLPPRAAAIALAVQAATKGVIDSLALGIAGDREGEAQNLGVEGVEFRTTLTPRDGKGPGWVLEVNLTQEGGDL